MLQMTIRSLAVVLASIAVTSGVMPMKAAELSIRGEEMLLDGRAVKAIGLRCSNSLLSDATTDQLIKHLDVMRSYGLNTVSVFVMGSRFGDSQGYRPDGSLGHGRRQRRHGCPRKGVVDDEIDRGREIRCT